MPRSNSGNPNDDDLIARGGKVDRERLFELYEKQTGDDEQPISVTLRISRNLNKRLDRYLVDRIPFLSRTSLQRLIRDHADRTKMREHFRKLEAYRKTIDRHSDAYGILNHLNQLGVYKRHRADRRLHMQGGLDTHDHQRAQMQRDLDNGTCQDPASTSNAVSCENDCDCPSGQSCTEAGTCG